MSSGQEIFAKTIYAEARGEPEAGQKEVARVIRERAAQNKSYWGGNTIEGVCRYPEQFECWNNVEDIHIGEPNFYRNIRSWSDDMYNQPLRQDSKCPDHYNNPAKERRPTWVDKCNALYKIGRHQFYRTKPEYQ